MASRLPTHAQSQAEPSWTPAKVIGGVVWSLLFVAVFTPWFREGRCGPFPAGTCSPRWSNLIFGWEFRDGFPYWVLITAGLIGFVVGWAIVSVLHRLFERVAALMRTGSSLGPSRRALWLVVAVVLVVTSGVVVWQSQRNPCDVLQHLKTFDAVSDLPSTGGEPTLEAAAEAAFQEAGVPRRVERADMDPVLAPTQGGNLYSVGVDGERVVIARTNDGYLFLDGPVSCSDLAQDLELVRD